MPTAGLGSVFPIELYDFEVDLLFGLQPVVAVLAVLAAAGFVEFEGTRGDPSRR
jgi:hypothetical protein